MRLKERFFPTRRYRPRRKSRVLAEREYREFLKFLTILDGSENGKTVRQMAKIFLGEVTDKTRHKIYGWLVKAKKYDNIPIWSHKIPHSKEKLYYLSRTWRDFNDTRTDLGNRVTLALHHAIVHDKRAKELGVGDNITKELKRRLEVKR